MLTAFILSCALHASPVELTPPPLPPAISTEARVKRFFAAFGGGLLGVAVGLAAVPLGDLACFGSGCIGPVHLVAASLTPLLAVTGAWAGFQLAGGDGGFAAALAVVVPALLLGQGLLLVAREANVTSAAGLLPFAIGGGTLLAAGAALALDLRAQQLERIARPDAGASLGRVASEVGISALAMLPGFFLSAAGFFLGGPLLSALLGVVTLPGAAAAAWGIHHANGGKGRLSAAMLGAGAGAVAMIAATMLFALNQGSLNPSPVRDVANGLFFVETMAVGASFAPALALERSHTAAVEAQAPRISFGATPVQGGVMVGAAVRL